MAKKLRKGKCWEILNSSENLGSLSCYKKQFYTNAYNSCWLRKNVHHCLRWQRILNACVK